MAQPTLTMAVEQTTSASPPSVANAVGTKRGELLGADAPSGQLVAVTPADGGNIDPPYRGLYVGTAGNVAVIGVNDTVAVTFVGVLAGSILPVRVKSVQATNTTAGSIIGLI